MPHLALIDTQAARGVSLGIEVHQENLFAHLAEGGRQVHRGGGLADSSLLVDHGDDLRLADNARDGFFLSIGFDRAKRHLIFFNGFHFLLFDLSFNYRDGIDFEPLIDQRLRGYLLFFRGFDLFDFLRDRFFFGMSLLILLFYVSIAFEIVKPAH